MNSESSLYYNGFGNYDFPKNCHEKNPLRKLKKLRKKLRL